MKIDFKRVYTWSTISTIALTVMLIAWLCGAKLYNVNIFILFMAAILGNFAAILGDLSNSNLKKEIKEITKLTGGKVEFSPHFLEILEKAHKDMEELKKDL